MLRGLPFPANESVMLKMSKHSWPQLGFYPILWSEKLADEADRYSLTTTIVVLN
jgi:hypothetical protein